jgi:cell division inhibitor SepF
MTMSNWMKNTRTWLGLGNDPYYEDEYGDPGNEDDDYGYDDADEEPAEEQLAPRPVAARSAVRSVPPQRAPQRKADDWEEGDGGVRVISAPDPEPEPQQRGVVRPLPSTAKPFVVSPGGFNDVQQVADRFKRDQPVIVNLQGVDRDLSRRLIDFASGLCYGLEGDMERVADQVFLLTPRGAEVSDDDRRRLREGGLVDESR